jgi:small nuclear ribonucleoprotein (snRNP)-like protein
MKYLILLFLLTSCDPFLNSSSKSVSKDNCKRIKEKERMTIDEISYYIIEIDSVEYIVSKRGGICPLVKKQ